MFTVYILESETTGKLYIGQTNDIKRRLNQHHRGYVSSTKNRGPWSLLKTIELKTRSEAVQLERRLKRMKNPSRVKSFLKNYHLGMSQLNILLLIFVIFIGVMSICPSAACS
ncbi:MAG: GIY-YIG nuclease family protein [Candidatus Marinimicrobia bacterium]|nr:GIY-YIG nuclease family protein [Candidatus Neomarinimicrobiota bacterium]MBT3631341.1 GIY-YIG nuclease family protein [Candidatus Neomarinimicrobiota bacterium]MBT3825181.1 GIY-YIG nuclease family protein [Candidatus Neomarinimicrobiota bacterium]MBT4129369.1 GIY-YIG nuclease family protein [Candidatus Neomarinimicrobiota bacterium]MBT4296473.1 GIY-YIG nuclease family protein [Candidatus Neomarinimicrobiota bacterium]